MVKIVLKGVHSVKARGRLYHYAWRGGPRLDGEPGTPEFLASYQSACQPGHGLDRTKLAAWVTLYKASADFRELAPSTRAAWDPWLTRVSEEFGKLSIRQFDRPQIRADIRRWRDTWRATPRSADYAKQVLSRVLSFAVAEGALMRNVCEDIPGIYSSNRAETIWEQAHLDALFKVATKEVVWAVKLAAHTGLRQSDLLRLSWSHIGDKAIEIKTGKSRSRKSAIIPITAGLRTLLETIPKRATTVLTNSRGRPWQGFNSTWTTTKHRAGEIVNGLHFHDLRGTAATNLYRAGFSPREIAVVLAWSEVRVERLIDLYVKRDEIIHDRIRRMEEAEARTKTVKQV